MGQTYCYSKTKKGSPGTIVGSTFKQPGDIITAIYHELRAPMIPPPIGPGNGASALELLAIFNKEDISQYVKKKKSN